MAENKETRLDPWRLVNVTRALLRALSEVPPEATALRSQIETALLVAIATARAGNAQILAEDSEIKRNSQAQELLGLPTR
jgi:hypothetical protein